MEFTLFFDSDCPMCRREVEWLERRNTAGRLAKIDIAAPDFDAGAYGLTEESVQAELHGLLPDGTPTVGMESMRRAWAAVGLGFVLAPTRWPVLKQISDLGYRIFARYRVPLGRLMGRGCDDSGACAVPRSREARGAGTNSTRPDAASTRTH